MEVQTNSLQVVLEAESICRVCLTISDEFELRFFSIKSEMQFQDFFSILTSVSVTENVDLPTKICEKCYKIVVEAKKLREKAQQSDQLLRVMMVKNSIPQFKKLLKSKDASSKKTLKYKCSKCNKAFENKRLKDRHELAHKPQHQCNVCLKVFGFESSLRRHLKQHNRDGDVVCGHCGNSFKDKDLLLRHIKLVHNGKSYKCPECNSTFSNIASLKTHRKCHTTDSERTYRCSYPGCNKTFNFKHHWKHHEMTHEGTKQYFCKVCGKGFIQAHHFTTHMKSHNISKWVMCPVDSCSKLFPNDYALKRHSIVHDEKKHMCSNCGKLLSSAQSLQSHMKKCDRTLNISKLANKKVRNNNNLDNTNNMSKEKDDDKDLAEVLQIMDHFMSTNQIANQNRQTKDAQDLNYQNCNSDLPQEIIELVSDKTIKPTIEASKEFNSSQVIHQSTTIPTIFKHKATLESIHNQIIHDNSAKENSKLDIVDHTANETKTRKDKLKERLEKARKEFKLKGTGCANCKCHAKEDVCNTQIACNTINTDGRDSCNYNTSNQKAAFNSNKIKQNAEIGMDTVDAIACVTNTAISQSNHTEETPTYGFVEILDNADYSEVPSLNTSEVSPIEIKSIETVNSNKSSSCKAVLGNCLASGDCLCARMADSMNEEEPIPEFLSPPFLNALEKQGFYSS